MDLSMKMYKAGKRLRARASDSKGTSEPTDDDYARADQLDDPVDEDKGTSGNDVITRADADQLEVANPSGGALVRADEYGPISCNLGPEFYPVMRCDGCNYQGACPLFKAGYECGYAHILERIALGKPEDRKRAKQELAEIQVKRVVLLNIHELNSGALSEELGSQLDRAIRMIEALDSRDLLEQSKGPSILQQIFSFNTNQPVGPPKVECEIRDATFELHESE